MSKGLYHNIHAKRKRIREGSGETMRSPGDKGAPSAQDFKDSEKTAKKGIKSYYGMGKKKKKEGIPSYYGNHKKKKKGLYSYAEDKPKKFSALSEFVSAPKEIKPEGKPKEELIYANKEEIKMLKKAGGSGTPTPYGKVDSYYLEGTGYDYQGTTSTKDAYSEGTTSSNTTGGTFSTLTQGGSPDRDSDNDNDNNRPPPPVDTSETKPYEGEGITLKGLYNAVNSNELGAYLDGFGSRTSTSTNSTGGTHTITYEALDHGLTSDMTLDDFYKDSQGNIIGWQTDDGTPDFENRDEWYVDGAGDWFYVGTGAVGGAGGEGSTTIIDAEGNFKTIGARTYAELLGFDQDLLDKAMEDRAQSVTELQQRQEYYGGKYLDAQGRSAGDEGFDSTTATFRGGKEQEMYDRADQYTGQFDRLMAEGEEKAKFWEQKSERLAGDDVYYEGMERRVRELADRGGVTPRDRQQSIYAVRSQQIEDDARNQEMQMRQMLAERGISANSPLAIRMMNNIKSNEAKTKREARRTALFDAMQMRDADTDRSLALYDKERNMREGRIGLYTGMGATALDQRLQQAGMYAQQGSEMFSRGSYFGSTAQNMANLRMAEAMDRQAGQEYKKLTGMSMDMSKYGMDKQAEIAKKMAAMKSAQEEGGSRSSLLGSLVGGAAGYFLSGGNPYMAGLGANLGSNLKIG